jgi:amino acid permease
MGSPGRKKPEQQNSKPSAQLRENPGERPAEPAGASTREQPSLTTELSRDLNLFHLPMMGVGMMIGAGVFVGIGNAMYVAGTGGVLLTFALNCLLALVIAMSYTELSSAIPRAGGVYNFARIGFGRSTSFMAGWMERNTSPPAIPAEVRMKGVDSSRCITSRTKYLRRISP